MRNLSGIGTIATFVVGATTAALGLLVFQRDKHRLRVAIRWYVSGYPRSATAGSVRVWNDGRRAVQVTRVGLTVNDGQRLRYLPLHLFPLSQMIPEAESTEFPFTLADCGISDVWHNVGAFAEDYAGKRYEAKK